MSAETWICPKCSTVNSKYAFHLIFKLTDEKGTWLCHACYWDLKEKQDMRNLARLKRAFFRSIKRFENEPYTKSMAIEIYARTTMVIAHAQKLGWVSGDVTLDFTK